MRFFDKTRVYAPMLVRYATGLVFLLIGLDQLTKPDLWASYFPTSLPFGMSVANAVFYNGIFDTLIGILLIVGLLTRLFAAIAALHLIGVIYTLGYNDIAIRDIGIFLAALSVFFYGSDAWSIDRKIWKH